MIAVLAVLAVGAAEGRVEADEVEDDLHPRAVLGTENGEQREPHAAGGPGPGQPRDRRSVGG